MLELSQKLQQVLGEEKQPKVIVCRRHPVSVPLLTSARYEATTMSSVSAAAAGRRGATKLELGIGFEPQLFAIPVKKVYQTWVKLNPLGSFVGYRILRSLHSIHHYILLGQQVEKQSESYKLDFLFQMELHVCPQDISYLNWHFHTHLDIRVNHFVMITISLIP